MTELLEAFVFALVLISAFLMGMGIEANRD